LLFIKANGGAHSSRARASAADDDGRFWAKAFEVGLPILLPLLVFVRGDWEPRDTDETRRTAEQFMREIAEVVFSSRI
jgi:hypothetical protein